MLPLSEISGVELPELGSHISVASLFLPSWTSFNAGTALWSKRPEKFSSKFPGNSGSVEPNKLSNGTKLWISMLSISKKGKEGLKLWKSAMWFIREVLKGFKWYLDNVAESGIYNVGLV